MQIKDIKCETFFDSTAKEKNHPNCSVEKKQESDNGFDSIFQREIKKVKENGNKF